MFYQCEVRCMVIHDTPNFQLGLLSIFLIESICNQSIIRIYPDIKDIPTIYGIKKEDAMFHLQNKHKKTYVKTATAQIF